MTADRSASAAWSGRLRPDAAKAGDARISRARTLATTHPEAAEPLTFYANLVELQQSVLDAHAGALRAGQAFAESLDFEVAADAMPSFLTRLVEIAPAPLADAARAVLQEGHDTWRHLIHTCWNGERGGNDRPAFIAEALLQPFAEKLALCRDQPVVAVLRDVAHGAKRSYVCGFCLAEWPAPRLGCPACGESRFEKLAVYRADEFSVARIDACETCRAYVKTIDLTKDATAVPVVDDIATLTLDVWARERGFRRLYPNLLRL